ncbi:MAG: 50S ribosomal protein L4 [Actinobacteria bacterium RBG_16_64_13]|nr:MAG: 50S ribosomal protein L4 [Actinobacteria bacterium RBG_16_64_13]
MSSIDRIDENGAVVGQHELADALLADQINVGLLHQVVTAELAGHRQGTAAAKSRSQVAGTGAKQWRQKGTGRARVGSGKVSQFTGGGVAFPPIPRSYSMKVNKKAKALAFRMALADLVAGGTVRVLSGTTFDEPSAKRAAGILGKIELEKPLLVLVGGEEVAALKSFRNLAGTRVLTIGEAEVQDYIWAKSLLFTDAAVAFLERGLNVGGDS